MKLKSNFYFELQTYWLKKDIWGANAKCTLLDLKKDICNLMAYTSLLPKNSLEVADEHAEALYQLLEIVVVSLNCLPLLKRVSEWLVAVRQSTRSVRWTNSRCLTTICSSKRRRSSSLQNEAVQRNGWPWQWRPKQGYDASTFGWGTWFFQQRLLT